MFVPQCRDNKNRDKNFTQLMVLIFDGFVSLFYSKVFITITPQLKETI